MKHCIVTFEVGNKDFKLDTHVLIETDGKEIKDAITNYFSNYWGSETHQTEESEGICWFNKDEVKYAKLVSMNMIQDTDAYVLRKYINHYND